MSFFHKIGLWSPPNVHLKVHLRGLPYRSTEREIADWLTEAADPVEVTSLCLDDDLIRLMAERFKPPKNNSDPGGHLAG